MLMSSRNTWLLYVATHAQATISMLDTALVLVCSKTTRNQPEGHVQSHHLPLWSLCWDILMNQQKPLINSWPINSQLGRVGRMIGRRWSWPTSLFGPLELERWQPLSRRYGWRASYQWLVRVYGDDEWHILTIVYDFFVDDGFDPPYVILELWVHVLMEQAHMTPFSSFNTWFLKKIFCNYTCSLSMSLDRQRRPMPTSESGWPTTSRRRWRKWWKWWKWQFLLWEITYTKPFPHMNHCLQWEVSSGFNPRCQPAGQRVRAYPVWWLCERQERSGTRCLGLCKRNVKRSKMEGWGWIISLKDDRFRGLSWWKMNMFGGEEKAVTNKSMWFCLKFAVVLFLLTSIDFGIGEISFW